MSQNPSGSPTKNPKNHYETLGVTRYATQAEIRRAYLDAARRWHPDRHSSGSASEARKAEQAMRQVNEAWSVLGDKEARAGYDRRLSGRIVGSTVAGGAGSGDSTAADDRVIRIDPRLLDPEFLAARREAQFEEVSRRTALAVRVGPLLAILGLLVAVFVFTAYARNDDGEATPVTVPGPDLGAGIEANDCVVVTTGPALLEVPCTSPATERVIGARLADGVCPLGTTRDVTLSNGSIACLAAG
jgi:hypothetical protein